MNILFAIILVSIVIVLVLFKRRSENTLLKNKVLKSPPYVFQDKVSFVSSFHNPWKKDAKSFVKQDINRFKDALELLTASIPKNISEKQLRLDQKATKASLEIYRDEIKGWGIKAAKDIDVNQYIGIYPGNILFHRPFQHDAFIMTKSFKAHLTKIICNAKRHPSTYPFTCSETSLFDIAYSYSFSSETLGACIQYVKDSRESQQLFSIINNQGNDESVYDQLINIFFEKQVERQEWLAEFSTHFTVTEQNNHYVENFVDLLKQVKKRYYLSFSIVSFTRINELVLINTSSDKSLYNITAEILQVDSKPLICFKTTKKILKGQELLADYGQEYVKEKAIKHLLLGVSKQLPFCFK